MRRRRNQQTSVMNLENMYMEKEEQGRVDVDWMNFVGLCLLRLRVVPCVISSEEKSKRKKWRL